jgi:tryptophan 2,3-dioxygenase
MKYKSINGKKFKQLPDGDQKNPELIKAMHFDHTVNITWVMQHLNVAIKYIEHGRRGWESRPEEVIGKNTCTLNTSEGYFFQSYGAEELANWGVEI